MSLQSCFLGQARSKTPLSSDGGTAPASDAPQESGSSNNEERPKHIQPQQGTDLQENDQPDLSPDNMPRTTAAQSKFLI